jgi:putative transposase
MMSNRDYKEFAEGEYYHIYNRGNGKMDIFCDDQDNLNFIKRLTFILGLTKNIYDGDDQNQRRSLERMKSLPKNSFTIICYCLIPNHFHILSRQNSDISISKLITKLCTSYSKYYNKKYEHIGHVFQDKFKAVLVEDNKQLLWLSAYIHQNPKVAKLVKNLKSWQWSSYTDYVDGKGILCDKDIILGQFKNISDYVDFVDESFELIKEKKDLQDIFLD